MLATSSTALPQAGASSTPRHHLGRSLYGTNPAGFWSPRQHMSIKASKNSDSSPSTRQASKAKQSRLVNVDGLGRKYEGLLQQRGIRTVDQLAEVILDKLSGPSLAAQQASKQQGNGALAYLKGLGIRRIDHANKIIKYIQEHYGGQPQLLTFCVEGNISAGKSTFLNYIREGNEQLAEELEVVPEPVDKWQDVKVRGPDGDTQMDLLKTFYKDPERYAFSFQNFVFMTRFQQEMDSSSTSHPVRVMERSIFSDRLVFVRAVHDNGWMGDVEVAVYDSMFGPILESRPTLKPDGFIYLRCNPEVCMERVRIRNRGGEGGITLDYLDGLHSKHEDWLMKGDLAQQWLNSQQPSNSPTSSSSSSYGSGSGSGLILPQGVGGSRRLIVPSSIDTELYVLKQNLVMHDALDGVPALVLDCSQDVLRNQYLKEEFQRKVMDYIVFMRDLRLAQAISSSGGAGGGLGFGSSSGSRDLLGVGQGPADGAPSAEQQERLDMVQEAANEVAGIVKAVPSAPGDVLREVGGEEVATAGAGVGVSGGLEALMVAQQAHGKQQQQLQQGVAVMR